MSNQNQREFRALGEFGSFIDANDFKAIFLVVDRAACEAAGVFPRLSPFFKGRSVFAFDQFIENPRLEHIKSGVDAFRETEADLVFAVGGGTAIDVGKMIRFFARQEASPESIIADSNLIRPETNIPFAAIPTTAGSGSEATHFAVVYVDGVKFSVAHDSILPNMTVVDPTLTYSMPPGLTATSGLDVLCQGIESMWSVNSTSESYGYGIEALALAVENLHAAVSGPTPASRSAMSRAANLAGKAINISKTTAPHAVSYAITTGFGVPHGHAVALTLAPFLEFNADVDSSNVADSRGVDHVRKVIGDVVETLGCKTTMEAQGMIRSLMNSIGCVTCLGDVGVTSKAQRLQVAKSVNAARLANNPRVITGKDIDEILESIR